MGEIGVHLEEPVIAPRNAPAESLEVGRSQAELPCPMQDVNARVVGGHHVRQRAGAIRRCVIDNQHLETGILLERHGKQARQVVALVVRRNDDESALGAGIAAHAVVSRTRSRGSSGRSASGRISPAVNHRRDTIETTTAAGAPIAVVSSATMESSRTPAPPGSGEITPTRYDAATAPAK